MRLREIPPKAVRWLALSVGALALVVALSCATFGEKAETREAPPAAELAARPPPPESLGELVERSEMIVTGRIVGLVDVDQVYPEGSRTTATPPRDGIDLGVAFSNLRVEVSEYLLGEGPQEIVLRQFGDVRDDQLPWAQFVPAVDEEVILFLRPVEGQRTDLDGLYWPVLGWWGEMVVRDGRVGHFDLASVPVVDDASAEAVKDDVRRLARQE